MCYFLASPGTVVCFLTLLSVGVLEEVFVLPDLFVPIFEPAKLSLEELDVVLKGEPDSL